MGTPHNEAAQGAFAKTVLMPGDPLRAKFIAETFLQDAKLVNNVRGVQGYTGTYQGTPVSVMASGLGMPSLGIYGPVLQRRRGGQAGPGHLYHLRQLDYRRGAACRRPPDHLHPDDGDRPGRCCGDGEEVRRVQKRRIRPRGHAGEA